MADDITFIPQNQLCITKAGVYNMKQIPWSCWLLIGAMIILALCAVFFLPDQIAVQWNSNGVSGVADKWIVFVFPLLSLFIIAVTAVRKKSHAIHLAAFGRAASCVWLSMLYHHQWPRVA